LTGSGTAAITHSVSLSWDASTSTVAGYNIYRGTVSGGPYSKINSSADANTSYTDSSVQSGTTYYYVTTSVDNSGDESVNSNQVSAAIPTP
jgi:fibronectin type 3 domain-containing protein